MIRKTMAALLPRRLLLVRGPSDARFVCLTFDDGPDPRHTPWVLDVLKAHGIQATFFVIGQKAKEHPDLLRRMMEEGHVIGHHSFYHRDPQATTARQLLDELECTDRVLREVIGRPSRVFRPPHGQISATKLLRLWFAGRCVVLWNADPKDFQANSPRELSDWFASNPLCPGDVVLLHDRVECTAQVLAEIIASAQGRGLQFATIEQWIS